MIFMILEAKMLERRVPGLNEDLLNIIKKNYLDVDMFRQSLIVKDIVMKH